MCCFSAHVSAVSNTNIFARAADAGRQFLVYSMQYEAAAELAMILPIPVPGAPPEDAVRFIDLSDYSEFFEDIRLGFPEPKSRGGFQPQALSIPKPAPLKVHDVGSFEASFVPGQADFSRLDPRFRLPPNAWNKLPRYRDWGFAVFKLKAGARKVHPLAFEFPRRDPEQLFFPTVHIHDGAVHRTAEFDHALYCQTPEALEDKWDMSDSPAGQFMAVDKAGALVDPEARIKRRRIRGLHKNEDIVIGPPEKRGFWSSIFGG